MTRLSINLEDLAATLRERSESWESGETSMTVLSREELVNRLGVVPPPGAPSLQELDKSLRTGRPQAPFTAAAAVGAPPAYDLRNVAGQSFVSQIRDQGNCGSCVAFGVVATLECSLKVATGDPTLQIDLSEAQLFYCYGRNRGATCETGWSPDQALDDCRDHGLGFEQSYQYTAGDQNCSGLDANWRTHFVTLTGRSALSGAAIKQWIATTGAVSACFSVYEDFYAYRSGVYHHVSGNQVGGHCVSLVGYDDAQSCWIAKNSWGPGWGEGGFFRIGYGECGIDSWIGPYGAEGVSLSEISSAWSGWASEGGVLTSDIAACRNADGRLEVFVRGTDNAVWHDWQVTPNGGWAGWASLGGVITSNIAVAANADGRLEVFARGTDNALWHQWQVTPGGGWSGWASLGGVITSDATVCRNADGRLEVFARGTDNALWHQWQVTAGGGWSGWASLGGVLTSQISAGVNTDGRMEVFVRGTDNALWHQWQVTAGGGWSGWASLGGVLTSDIAVGQNADGRLEVFVRGTDNALWHQWQVSPGGGWSGWASEGGVLTSDISIARSPGGRLEVFVRGTDNALWHKWQVAPNGGWSAWDSLGGVLTSDIAATVNADGRLEVFVRGTDNALWHDWQSSPIALASTGASNAASRAKRPQAQRPSLNLSNGLANQGAE